MSAPNYIMSLGVGWLALLILTWGQCEGPTAGIGAEKQTPTSFFVSTPKSFINCWIRESESKSMQTTNNKLHFIITLYSYS